MAEAKAVVMKFHAASNTESYVPSEEEREPKPYTSAKPFYCNLTLMRYSLINSINFFVVYNCNYVITLNTENLSGDCFLNFLINGLVDIPAITIALLFSNKIGRKRLYLFGMAVAGLSLLCSATTLMLIEGDAIALIIMTMVGKTGTRISMCIIYVWSDELFPTTMRGSIMGIGVTCGNAGLVVSPYIARLSTIFPEVIGPAGPLIFGSLAIVSAVLTLTFPETKHKALPETLAHVQQMTRY
ncbi:organic cation transporter-like protein [Pecten maximus]|uniref:organic cation transporter-like protein n=1 Tax=Pecten maximus TaxID=6579 RepID=UPI001458C96A|nr:organic cation transporter-like protein [Pecten maximus]